MTDESGKREPPASIKIIGGKNNVFHRVEIRNDGPALDIENAENLTVHSLTHSPPPPPNIYNVTSINSSGITAGHIDQVNVVGTPPRVLTDDGRAALLRIPHDGPIEVLARQGDREAHEFASQIYSFLSASGFSMGSSGPGWHMFGTQVTDVTVTPFQGIKGPEYHVLIESRK